jgi:maleamate amidohydrolase
MSNELDTYQRQSFGSTLEPKAPVALLIVDFVNGFADPGVFGGGNIGPAIERTVGLSPTHALCSPTMMPTKISSR